jgi:hypothetical protein
MTRATYISLSSIPPRFPHLGPVLQSLLEQQGGPVPVLLYIPQSYRRFPDWDGQLPEVPAGVTIIRTAQDDGPATKVLPALRQFAGQDVNIVFCDDDNHYPRDWLAGFLAASAEHPDAAIAMSGAELRSLEGFPRPSDRQPRAERWVNAELGAYLAQLPAPLPLDRPMMKTSGYMDTVFGRGGVMVRPAHFTEEVFHLPPVVWSVDDYWLSGHLESNGVPIWVDNRIPNPATDRCLTLIRPLLTDVIENHDRWAANAACIEWFRQEKGIWHPGAPAEPPAHWAEKKLGTKAKSPKRARKAQRPPLWKRLLRRLLGRRNRKA